MSIYNGVNEKMAWKPFKITMYLKGTQEKKCLAKNLRI
jgi:hypothetical protein